MLLSSHYSSLFHVTSYRPTRSIFGRSRQDNHRNCLGQDVQSVRGESFGHSHMTLAKSEKNYVHLYGSFLTCGYRYPQIIHFSRMFHHKPSIWVTRMTMEPPISSPYYRYLWILENGDFFYQWDLRSPQIGWLFLQNINEFPVAEKSSRFLSQ